MQSPAVDMADILESSAIGAGDIGASSGWSIHVSTIPDDSNTPDTVIGLFDYGGGQPIANYTYDYPSVQVRVRGAKAGYQAAWTKANEIKEALHGLANETWNGTRYIQILCTSDVMFVGYDENHRPILTVNFEIHRTE